MRILALLLLLIFSVSKNYAQKPINSTITKADLIKFIEQAKEEGKPDDIIPRMVEGRLNKFFQENCLLEQTYIKDSDKKVKDILTESIATLGENISLNRYTRFAIGESS